MTVDIDPPERGSPPAWSVLLAVAASGAAVTIVEMSAVRTLQPFFGSTTQVWANVIAVVLGALALGYALAGRIADRRGSATLLFGVLTIGGALVATTAIAVTPASLAFLQAGVDVEGMAAVSWRGSLGVALVVFAPPLVLLAMASPLAVRLLATAGAGRAAGHVSAVGTAASVAGIYLPALVLVPHLGSRGSLLVAAATAVVPASVFLAIHGRVRARSVAATAVAATAIVVVCADRDPARPAPVFDNGGVARVLTECESEYQYITVREDRFAGGEVDRVLTLNEGSYVYQSLRVEGHVLTSSRNYDDYTVLPILLDLPQDAELRLGVVGFACGVNAAQWRHFWHGPYRLRVEGAELDADVVRLGREYFGLAAAATPDASVTIADGRTWLVSLPESARFHVLVIDAFANEIYMPFHLATLEFLELCRRRLEPGGLVAMNVCAVGADAPNLAALENTLATVFGACVRSSRYRGAGFLLLARNAADPPDLRRLAPPAVRRRFGRREQVKEWDALLDLAAEVGAETTLVRPRTDARVFTDDDAPLEYLTDRAMSELERSILGLSGAASDVAEGTARLGLIASESGQRDRLRALVRKQDRMLAGIAAGWLVALVALVTLTRRSNRS